MDTLEKESERKREGKCPGREEEGRTGNYAKRRGRYKDE